MRTNNMMAARDSERSRAAVMDKIPAARYHEGMKDEEPISRRGMFIGLRIFAVLILAAGSLFAGSGNEVLANWHAGSYGAAIGGFAGRLLFWLVLAVYAWVQAGRYRGAR